MKSFLTEQKFLWIVVFGALYLLCIPMLVDSDIWWHLKTGEVILSQGWVAHDLFSLDFKGAALINHEWLAQIIFFLGFKSLSFLGLYFVFSALLFLSFLLLFPTASKPHLFSAPFILLAALASKISFGVRPQMLSLFFLALLLWMLERVRRGEWSVKRLWFLPPFFLLWANIHAAFIVGIGLMVIIVAGDYAELRLKRGTANVMNQKMLAMFGAVILVCALVSLVNPYGVKIWLHPFQETGNSFNYEYIYEWWTPDFKSPIFWPFLALLGLGVAGLFISRKNLRTSDYVFVILLGAMAVRSMRHIAVFSIVATPVIVRSWEGWREKIKIPDKFRETLNKFPIVLWILLCGLGFVGTKQAYAKYHFVTWSIPANFPLHAYDFIRSEGLQEKRIFNDYGWGGYLIWQGLPVFCDPRSVTVYNSEFMVKYFETLSFHPEWNQRLQGWKMDYVLINQARPLAGALQKHPDWQKVHEDHLAEIYKNLAVKKS